MRILLHTYYSHTYYYPQSYENIIIFFWEHFDNYLFIVLTTIFLLWFSVFASKAIGYMKMGQNSLSRFCHKKLPSEIFYICDPHVHIPHGDMVFLGIWTYLDILGVMFVCQLTFDVNLRCVPFSCPPQN